MDLYRGTYIGHDPAPADHPRASQGPFSKHDQSHINNSSINQSIASNRIEPNQTTSNQIKLNQSIHPIQSNPIQSSQSSPIHQSIKQAINQQSICHQ